MRRRSFLRLRSISPALLLLTAAIPPLPPVFVQAVDPRTTSDDDVARHRDAGDWRGLSVQRVTFREGGTTWRLWRVVNRVKPAGPLWVVPHDSEDAAFSAGLVSVRSWGGVMMAVDTDAPGGGAVSRFNRQTSGAPIDPNRNFRDTLPAYAGAMLADLGSRPRAIVALHTNAIGFDGARSTCGGGGGSGDISIRLCSERYHPRASKGRAWPFDDDDTLALIPYVPGAPPATSFCGTALLRADANVVFERVVTSDGSLSNYAVQHGVRYVNLETADRGNDARGVAMAQARLVRMADMVMERCGEVRGAVLRGR